MSGRFTTFTGSTAGAVVAGGLIGVLAGLLPRFGNPPNMGICVACFERDLAGALGLHRAAVVQYLRPEIPGFVLGSLLAALLFREFRPRGGAAPVIRFVLGAFAMIGALAFLGCPWRALLRLAGGDLNALLGLAGLTIGITVGTWFLRRGFTLGRTAATASPAGWTLPVLMIGAVVLAIAKPAFLLASETGPGALHAPLALSLGAALVIGFVAQRTRFCTVGAIRNTLFARDVRLLAGIATLVVAALVVNLALGRFDLGLTAQPVAHSLHLWNVLGMVLAGLAFVLGGGCPGRQLFLAGEGDGDAAVFVLGMIAGAAFAHNFALAAVPDRLVEGVLTVGGPGVNGRIAVVLGLAVCLAVGFGMREVRRES